MKKYHNYPEIFEALKAREPFTGNSAMAVRVDSSPTSGSTYTVYSYFTVIFVFDLENGKVLRFNRKVYSKTTTKLQTLIEQAFADEIGEYYNESD